MLLKLLFIVINVISSACVLDINGLVSRTGDMRSEGAIVFVLVAQTFPHLFDSTFSLFIPLKVSFIGGTLGACSAGLGLRIMLLLLLGPAYLMFK